MAERYQPNSAFLKAVIADEAPLSGWAGDANRDLLIEMTTDPDLSNRDWATMLLGQVERDEPAIRAALLRAATDEDMTVRGEAVLGLARLDPALALSFVQRGLAGEVIGIPLLEAAKLCAHPSLIDDLRVWAQPSDEPFIDGYAAEALAACEAAAKA